MPTPPVLDPRQADDLVERLRHLALGTFEAPGFVFGEWAGRQDTGMVLMRIFARFMEMTLERLNRVPEKNLLAFLDLMGVGVMPPAMARVPLTFTLAGNAGPAGLLPRGTQVAVPQTDPPVVFETEDDLVVHAARLAAAWSVSPPADRYGDRALAVAGDGAFPAFDGERRIEHALYLGGGGLFAWGGARTLTLSFPLPAGADVLGTLSALAWEAWRGGEWRPLTVVSLTATAGLVELTLPSFAGADAAELSGAGLAAGTSGRWIRGRLRDPFHEVFVAPALLEAARVDRVEARVRRSFPARGGGGAPLPPDLVQVNTAAVDAGAPFAAFGEAPRPGDTLYLASAEALTAPVDPRRGGPDTHLYVEIDHGDPEVTWKAAVWGNNEDRNFVGGNEKGMARWARVVPPPPAGGEPDLVAALSLPGTLSLPGVPRPPAHTIWVLYVLRAELTAGAYRRPPAIRDLALFPAPPVRNAPAGQTPPPIGGTLVLLSEGNQDHLLRFKDRGEGVPGALLEWVGSRGEVPVPADAFAGTPWKALVPAAPGGPFFPFGPAPAPGAVVYLLHLREVEAGPPASLSFSLAVRTARLAWEYHAAGGWRSLGESTAEHGGTGEVRDETHAFTRSGRVAFRRPADAAPVEVNGRAGHWLRVRVASGDYGRAVQYVPLDPRDAAKGMRPVPGTGVLGSPVVKSVSWGYEAAAPLRLLSHSHLEWREPGPGGALFVRPPETDPALYLGFDQPFAERAASLYVSVPPRQLVELADGGPPSGGAPGRARVAWEYWNGARWAPLPVVDDTRALTESGTVQFPGLADHAPRAVVRAAPLYWLRARREAAGPGPAPFLRGVYPNTVRAVQGATVAGEVLGSGTGRPGQAVRLARTPVQAGQVLRVREPERPSPADVARLEAEGGPAAVVERPAPGGGAEYWVRWTEVPTALVSDPRGRHYTLDRVSGVVRFGDGVRGMVPPAGRDNLLMEHYRAGGGAAGNQPAGAVRQLRSALSHVAAVANPEAADGGADAESLADVALRGPQTLRHRDRAVSAGDYEWLAREAAGNRVARAHALSARDRWLRASPGWVTVVLVPRAPDPRPFPGGELVRQVEDFFAARAPTLLVGGEPARVNVVGPGYVPASLEVRVRPVSLAAADAVRQRVAARLDAFFHPLLGGADGAGWPFGRDVYLSEVYAVLEAVEGVEHVVVARFRPGVATLPLRLDSRTPALPPGGAPAGTPVELLDGGGVLLRGRLAEALPGGVPPRELMVTGFQEGEGVVMEVAPGDRLQAVVRRVTLDTLEVDPFVATDDFPAGTPVRSADGAVSALLAAGLARGQRVAALAVRGVHAAVSARLLPVPAPVPPWPGLPLLREPNGGPLVLGERLRVGPASLPYSGTHGVSLDYSTG